MIYYRKTLFGRGPKLTAVHWASTGLVFLVKAYQIKNHSVEQLIS